MQTHLRNCNKRFGKEASLETPSRRNYGGADTPSRRNIGARDMNSIDSTGEATPSRNRNVQSKMMSKGKLDALNNRNNGMNRMNGLQ